MKRLLVAVLLMAACASPSEQAAQPVPSQPPTPSASSCPAAPRGGFAWPSPVPKDLPQPPTAVFGNVQTTAQGLTIVRFHTSTSLRDGVLFVVQQTQRAGFTLGRGDAEPAEADAPFGRGDLSGLYKMLVRDTCSTDWLVAVTRVRRTGTSPLLPRVTTASPSPLPFG